MLSTVVLSAAPSAAEALAGAALPWLRTDEWHHIAAVVSTSTACYFIDGLRIGCAPFTNITGFQPIYGDELGPTFFVGGTNGATILCERKLSQSSMPWAVNQAWFWMPSMPSFMLPRRLAFFGCSSFLQRWVR